VLAADKTLELVDAQRAFANSIMGMESPDEAGDCCPVGRTLAFKGSRF
jgi:hypothetical protein